MIHPTHFQSWTDHYASTSMLAADPALILEAIEAQADVIYDRITGTNHVAVTRKGFRRVYIDRVYDAF